MRDVAAWIVPYMPPSALVGEVGRVLVRRACPEHGLVEDNALLPCTYHHLPPNNIPPPCLFHATCPHCSVSPASTAVHLEGGGFRGGRGPCRRGMAHYLCASSLPASAYLCTRACHAFQKHAHVPPTPAACLQQHAASLLASALIVVSLHTHTPHLPAHTWLCLAENMPASSWEVPCVVYMQAPAPCLWLLHSA
jgi:hypothetical protein